MTKCKKEGFYNTNFLCDSCTNKTGNECKCDLVSDVCPFYEGDN